jgi:hypothetical protein
MCYLIESLNEITEKITVCAIEVHRNSDSGLLESIYENGIKRIILCVSESLWHNLTGNQFYK